ncbi:MAG: 4Fe-4S dicluster domain-containing protein [Candidatus Omnitrophota bacterium]
MTRHKRGVKFRVKVDRERCKGCSLCVTFCPKKELRILSQNKNSKGYRYVTFSGSNCIGCLRCGLICPDVALTIIQT